MVKVKINDDGIAEITVKLNSKKDVNRMFELIKEQLKAKHTIMIVVNSSKDEFYNTLGLICSKQFGGSVVEDVFGEASQAYDIIGWMMVDFYIQDYYYIKSVADKAVYMVRSVSDEGNLP